MLTTHLGSQIWGMPIAIGVMSAVGLISALLGDGIWDTVSLDRPRHSGGGHFCGMAGRSSRPISPGFPSIAVVTIIAIGFDRNGYVKRVSSGQCGSTKVTRLNT